MSYVSTGEEKFARERYNRVEAITNVTIEGTKNTCVTERHEKPVAYTICSKKDIRCRAPLIIRAQVKSDQHAGFRD